MGENIKNIAVHSGLSNQALTGLNYGDYERYCMGVWHSDEIEMKEEKKVNKFLEIKKGQEIDWINEKYNDARQEIIKNDKIQRIISDLEQSIKDIYVEENRETEFVPIIYNKYTKETIDKVEELANIRDKEIKTIKMKYAEVAALVEDMPATDRIEIYKKYEILD